MSAVVDDVVAPAQQDPRHVQTPGGVDARLAQRVGRADEEADLGPELLEPGGHREGLLAGSRQVESPLRVSRVSDHQGAQRSVRQALGQHPRVGRAQLPGQLGADRQGIALLHAGLLDLGQEFPGDGGRVPVQFQQHGRVVGEQPLEVRRDHEPGQQVGQFARVLDARLRQPVHELPQQVHVHQYEPLRYGGPPGQRRPAQASDPRLDGHPDGHRVVLGLRRSADGQGQLGAFHRGQVRQLLADLRLDVAVEAGQHGVQDVLRRARRAGAARGAGGAVTGGRARRAGESGQRRQGVHRGGGPEQLAAALLAQPGDDPYLRELRGGVRECEVELLRAEPVDLHDEYVGEPGRRCGRAERRQDVGESPDEGAGRLFDGQIAGARADERGGHGPDVTEPERFAEQGGVHLDGAAFRQGAHRPHADDRGAPYGALLAGEVRDFAQLGFDPAELGVLRDGAAGVDGDGPVECEFRGRGHYRLVMTCDVQIGRDLRDVAPDHGDVERWTIGARRSVGGRSGEPCGRVRGRRYALQQVSDASGGGGAHHAPPFESPELLDPSASHLSPQLDYPTVEGGGQWGPAGRPSRASRAITRASSAPAAGDAGGSTPPGYGRTGTSRPVRGRPTGRRAAKVWFRGRKQDQLGVQRPALPSRDHQG